MTKLTRTKHLLLGSILGALALATQAAAPNRPEPDRKWEYKVASPSDLLRAATGEIMSLSAADRSVGPLHIATAKNFKILGSLRVTTAEKTEVLNLKNADREKLGVLRPLVSFSHERQGGEQPEIFTLGANRGLGKTVHSLEQALNRVGGQGWELVCATEHGFVFKRPASTK